jgi:hypothetical protein
MSEPDYPRFLRELLDSCPKAHNGVHPWLFRVARYLHRFHSPEEACAVLEQCVANCGRPVEPHEIVDAVRNSGACKWEPDGKTASERRAEWLASPTLTKKHVPEFNPELAVKTAERVSVERVSVDITPGWLKSHSPNPVFCSTGQFLQTIFAPDEKSWCSTFTKVRGASGRTRCRLIDSAKYTGPTAHGSSATRLMG